MADEVEEVYALLSRHRLTIIRELDQTNLIQILVKNSVINVEDEELINSEVELEKRCDQLIEIVAKDGFEKFKQFCYAIETECSQLISDLINDKLSQSNEDSKEDTTALINDNYSIENGRETIDSNRSRRSTSYCGSATPTPVPNSPSRRSSLVCSSSPAPSSVPPPIPQLPAKSAVASNSSGDYGSSNKPKNYDPYGESKFSVSNSNFASPSANNQNDDNRNSHGQNSGSRLSQVSPYSYLQPKRFSSPSFGDYAYDKGVNVKNRTSSIVRSKSKKEQRNYHSMNETIEVLADQVVEDDRIVSTIC